MRRLLTMLLALALTGPSAGPFGLRAQATSAHACCSARMNAVRPCHAAVVSCCRPAQQPDRQNSVPPASGPLVAAPELAAMHGATAIAPDVLVAARTFALMAHSRSRFKSPPDPVYLRNAAFLV